MSSIILTNWTVYYASDTGGYKQISWTGAGAPETGINTVNELYSALTDLFSISAQNDAHDTTPMQAVTPTVYNIGTIDQRDQEAWFIDPVAIQHLTGGSIQTVGWTRVVNADTNVGTPGIVKMGYTAGGTAPSSADVGKTITMTTDGDTGTILYVDVPNLLMWIRPTDCTSAKSFDNAPTGNGAFTISSSAATGNQAGGAAVSGERLWSNIYTIGTIEAETQLYVTQSFIKFTPWWGSGHLDRLFLINDGFASGLIDRGLLTVYARQYSKLYDHFTSDVSSGGRNPIPLSTSDDSNNSTGLRKMTVAGSSGTWTVGNYLYDNTGGLTWTTTTRRGVITAVSGNDLTYYLISNNIDFAVGADDTQEYTGTANGDASATSISAIVDVGPSTSTLTVNYGYISRDISDGLGFAPYSVEVDLLTSISLADLYERVKYLTRPTLSPSDIDNGSQTVYGEQYVGVGDILLPYSSQSTAFTQGEAINGQTSGATGYVTADKDDGTTGTLTVRDVRGTFTNGENIRNVTTVRAVAGTPSSITPVKVSPFGTKAGSRFFGARGVWLKQVPNTDANNYEVIDNNGVSHTPPATVSVTVNGVVSGDRVSVFRASDTSGTINKTYMTSDNTANTAGLTTFQVDAIPADTPSAGNIRVINNPNPTEHRFRYASWTGTTFTLVTTGIPSGTIDAVGDVTGKSFIATNANLANILPGDLVRNTADGSPGSWAIVISVTLISGSQYQVVHYPLQEGTENDWDVGDTYSFNNLPLAYTNGDTAYAPYIDQTATSTSVSVNVIYSADRNISTQVRKKGIIPFNANTISLTSSGYTATAVRTTDSIVT
jgi:hypothetical protein